MIFLTIWLITLLVFINYVEGIDYIYVSDTTANAVYKIDPTSGSKTAFPISGLSTPRGIYVTSDEDVYIADMSNAAVKKYSRSTGLTTSIGSGFFRPTGVYLDSNNNCFVADYNGFKVYVIESPNYTVTREIAPTSFSTPVNLRIINGDLYVNDWGARKIMKVTNPLTNPVVTTLFDIGQYIISTGVTDINVGRPEGFDITSTGDLYYTDNNSRLWKLTAGATIPTLLKDNTLFSVSIHEVTVTSDGTVYVCDNGNSKIRKILNGGNGTVTDIGGFSTPEGIFIYSIASPTSQPSTQPSSRPSTQPSSRPSSQPSSQPSSMPSLLISTPSSQPSSQPSRYKFIYIFKKQILLLL